MAEPKDAGFAAPRWTWRWCMRCGALRREFRNPVGELRECNDPWHDSKPSQIMQTTRNLLDVLNRAGRMDPQDWSPISNIARHLDRQLKAEGL